MSERVVPVEVYSRVVGYFRPVDQWNKGKQEEFSARKTIRPDFEAILAPENEARMDLSLV